MQLIYVTLHGKCLQQIKSDTHITDELPILHMKNKYCLWKTNIQSAWPLSIWGISVKMLGKEMTSLTSGAMISKMAFWQWRCYSNPHRRTYTIEMVNWIAFKEITRNTKSGHDPRFCSPLWPWASRWPPENQISICEKLDNIMAIHCYSWQYHGNSLLRHK